MEKLERTDPKDDLFAAIDDYSRELYASTNAKSSAPPNRKQ